MNTDSSSPARRLTPAEREPIMLRMFAEGQPYSAIARAIGLGESRTWSILQASGQRRPTRNEQARRLREQILVLAARPDGGFRGGDLVDVGGISGGQVYVALRVMFRAGQLHKATVSTRNVHYFSTAALARAYLRDKAQTVAARDACLGSGAVRGPAHLPGEPVFTSRTVYTIAPPPPATSLRTNTYLRAD